MADERNDNIQRNLQQLSQIDGLEVLRDVHEFPGNRLRVFDTVSVLQHYYSHLEVAYDGNGNPTEVCYFKGISPHQTEIAFVGDSAGSLNNTYFIIYEGRTKKSFYVWYNVDNTGIDPAPISGATGIEVDISSNDAAIIVAQATELTLNSLYSDFFTARRQNAVLRIATVKTGETNNSIDGSTGFTFSNAAGTQQQVQKVRIDYDANQDPEFEGQVLKGYTYNIFNGKFEQASANIDADVSVEVDAADGDNIAISRHQNFRNITQEADFLPGALDNTTYTEIFSYTAVENLKLRQIKVKADTFGTFKIKINGTTVDYYNTSHFDRNCRIVFLEDQELNTTEELTVEFIPFRIQILTNYNFFLRMEGYA